MVRGPQPRLWKIPENTKVEYKTIRKPTPTNTQQTTHRNQTSEKKQQKQSAHRVAYTRTEKLNKNTYVICSNGGGSEEGEAWVARILHNIKKN